MYYNVLTWFHIFTQQKSSPYWRKQSQKTTTAIHSFPLFSISLSDQCLISNYSFFIFLLTCWLGGGLEPMQCQTTVFSDFSLRGKETIILVWITQALSQLPTDSPSNQTWLNKSVYLFWSLSGSLDRERGNWFVFQNYSSWELLPNYYTLSVQTSSPEYLSVIS